MPDTFIGDFTKVKDRNFNIKHLPEGDYKARVTKIEDHEAKSGSANWLYTVTVIEGPGRGASYPHYCGLEAEQLWKLRNLYAAAGIDIPKKKIKLRRDQMLNKVIGITLEDDEYEGKLKSVITATIPVDEIDSGEEADEDDEEVEDVEEPPRRAAKATKAVKKRAAPVVEEEEEDEEEVEEEVEEDEDEEELPALPKKRTAKAAAAVKKAARAKPAVVEDEDELEELEIDDL